MAKITSDQAKKWDAKCSNGFHFDIGAYIARGEKEIRKYIQMPDGSKLQARLMYEDVYQNFRLIGVRPTLHLSVWHDKGTVMTSSGLGVYIRLGEVMAKKTYSLLCSHCASYSDDDLLALAKKHAGRLACASIM